MAPSLMDAVSEDLRLEEQHDEYTRALQQVAEIVNWMPLAVSTSFRGSATISAERFALTLPTLSAVSSRRAGRVAMFGGVGRER
ncbi:hypothetical protein AB0M97_27170 [Streptomyces sp. NPDC051207]|uniref:hypothetical protein n=1 Tax=Streptomyces sp. NPDC051207 TaxID=3154641 RepID=UPI00343D31AA